MVAAAAAFPRATDRFFLQLETVFRRLPRRDGPGTAAAATLRMQKLGWGRQRCVQGAEVGRRGPLRTPENLSDGKSHL